MMEFIFSISY